MKANELAPGMSIFKCRGRDADIFLIIGITVDRSPERKGNDLYTIVLLTERLRIITLNNCAEDQFFDPSYWTLLR